MKDIIILKNFLTKGNNNTVLNKCVFGYNQHSPLGRGKECLEKFIA